MRVLVIHNAYRESGGEDRVVALETAMLADAGHEVVTAIVTNPSSMIATAVALASSPWNIRSERRLVDIAAEAKPDVVHVHNTWITLSPAVPAALQRAGYPVVVTAHNYRAMCVNAMLFRSGRPCEDCVGRVPWRGVRHRCYRNSAIASTMAAVAVEVGRRVRHEHLVLTPTEFARTMLMRSGVEPRRIRVKPNPVPDPGPRAIAPSASTTLLFVGRLSEEKGVRLLLDAWAASPPPDLELHLLGDGPERAELEALRLPGVHFLGQTSPEVVGLLMRSSRALLVPSQCYETFGLVALEGMAAGLPVAVSDLGALAEVACGVGPGPVAAGSIEGWCAVLDELRDDNAVEAWGAESRRRYDAEFSPGHGVASLVDAYESAIAAAATATAGPS